MLGNGSTLLLSPFLIMGSANAECRVIETDEGPSIDFSFRRATEHSNEVVDYCCLQIRCCLWKQYYSRSIPQRSTACPVRFNKSYLQRGC